MKLVFCSLCQDIVRPLPNRTRKCDCGKVSVSAHGKAKIEIKADKKTTFVFGFRNSNFVLALMKRPKKGWGKDFNSFVVAEECESVKWI